MAKLKIDRNLLKPNCIKFLFYLFVLLSFGIQSLATQTCNKLLTKSPLSRSKIFLHTPEDSLKKFFKNKKIPHLLHGTSSHTMVDAIKKSGIRGGEAIHYSFATQVYPEFLEKETRLLYTYLVTEDALLNSDVSLLKDTIQNSKIYAEINANESAFFNHFGLNKDLITRNVQSFIQDFIFNFNEHEYSDFLEELQDSTGPDRAAFEYVESTIGPSTDAEFSEEIRTLMKFKGVIVVFKNVLDLDDKLVPDPETSGEDGYIFVTESKSFDLNQVEALYPLSWMDYNLLLESFSSLSQ